MPDTIELKDMDALYGRLEKKVNVERQVEIDEFLRTKPTFDGRNPDGTTRFKLRTIPKTPNWNWRGQEVLAREIALDSERQGKIRRATSVKTLRRLASESLISETRSLAEDKLNKLLEEGEVERRRFFRGIQVSESREEAIRIAEEAEKSELISEKQKIVLRRMAEQKVFEEE